MALSFSRPDPSQPSAVSSASFALSRRGFDQAEVRDFLRMVAAELARLQERERFLEHELRSAQRSGPSPVAALDEEVVTRLLGEEAARILQTARDGAATIRQRAEEHAVRLLREANDEAHRIVQDAANEAQRTRQDAATDAESELAMAKQHGREMVTEVRAYRERVLGELARRRELAREQIEQLVHGRERLVQAFERARIAAVDVLGELAPLIEPDEYVNLAPTTGPVPLMVPNTPPPPQRRGPAFSDDDAPAPTAGASAERAAAAEVPDAPALRPADGEMRGGEGGQPADAHGSGDTGAADAGATRIFDVEVDDPELASTADADVAAADAPVEVEEKPVRRVPGVIDRSAAPPSQAEQAEAAVEGASAAADPVAVDGAGAPSPGAPTDDVVPGAVSTPARPARAKKSAPLSGETVIERPAGAVTSSGSSAASVASTSPNGDDDRPLAPVVSLFSGASSASTPAAATSSTTSDDVPPPPAAPAAPKSTVDDLFAKLRAARTDSVAEAVSVVPEPSHPSHGDDAVASPKQANGSKKSAETRPSRAMPRVPAIFQASPPEPTPVEPAEMSPADESLFGRRETAIAPLISTASRSLKRVLADEQNEVLAVLRRREPVRSLDALVPPAAEHIARYTEAIAAELLEAAVAGAASIEPAQRPALKKSVAAGGSVQRAAEMLVNQLVDPLRERLDRMVADAGGANAELAASLRDLYREWKTRHIDRNVDEAIRLAFGHGALSGVAPGTKICWLVDPSGPPCADADDNALGGPVSAGQPFPTDHLCAPAHAGCRCMLTKADR